MFLPNVCQLVRCTASPKQPQSETGFVNASINVTGVNITRRINTPQIPVFCLNPVRTENPAMNSAVQRKLQVGD